MERDFQKLVCNRNDLVSQDFYGQLMGRKIVKTPLRVSLMSAHYTQTDE